jgi:hypothetical protein
VAIAYSTYFKKLKEKGIKINEMNSQEELEKLDPIFPAKAKQWRREGCGFGD